MFKRRGSKSPKAGPRQEAGPPAGAARRAPRRGLRARLKFLFWVLLGVAVMGGAGYLVAALFIFPSPLLPNQREVARVMGLGAEAAQQRLLTDGLPVELGRPESHWSAPAGVVTWQDPPPGVAVPSGTTVVLTVSAGAPRVPVPDVGGMDLELAQRLLWAAGLSVEGADSVEGGGYSPGIAVATSPARGDSIALGRGVVIHLTR